MAKAPIEKHFEVKGFEDVESGIVKWPLSVIRLRSKDEKRLIELGTHILDAWRGYTDEEAFVFAETDGEPHNTITPIARKVGEIYEMSLPSTMYSASVSSSCFNLDGNTASPITSINPIFSFLIL